MLSSPLMAEPVLRFTDRGIYCPKGDFFIDPWRPVHNALITHGHSDHARWGHERYLATHQALPVIRHRLGQIRAQGIGFGERCVINGVTVSFHPAGHVPGSAQIRIEQGGEVWVVSGDYKVEDDGLSEVFEPVRCHTFISECTFGLPIFRWAPQKDIAQEIRQWRRANAAEGKTSVLGAYGLGKAQRLIKMLADDGPIVTHKAVEETNQILRRQGYDLPQTVCVDADFVPASYPGAIVIAPPSALGSAWVRRFGPVAEAFASGWMSLRGIRRRRGYGTGFTISDHADWSGLNLAIRETGAEQVFVTHGYTAPFRRWLEEQGLAAGIVQTEFGTEEDTPEDPSEKVVG